MDPLVHTVLSSSEHGHKQRLAALLQENPAMAEACDEEGSTPLMYAAANGRENVLHLLLQNHVEVDAQNLYGWTALMQAACYGHLTCVILLVQFKADVKLCNSWGASALVGAAQGGFATVVQFLLDQGAAVNRMGEVTSLTPLMAAAQCGHEDIAAKLLKAGSNVNAVLKDMGWSALMLAAVNNQKEMIVLLLQHGAEKEHKDISKRTAVQLATVLGHREAVQVLAGEQLEGVSDAEFFETVKAGQLDQVQAMLKESEALAKAKTKDGVTPLMRAANKGHVKICEVLLKAGCPVNAKDSVNGWTALMQATHQRRYEVARLLGQHGADVNLRGKSGSTAFDIANMLGDIEMIKIVANISVDRIRKVSAPPSVASSSATPPSNLPTNSITPTSTSPHSTPEPPATTTATTEGVVRKKFSVPTCPPRLKTAPPSKPLDTSELIQKLKMAYADPAAPSIPTSQKATAPPSRDSPGALPRFPSSRLRNQRPHPCSVASSLNSSTDTCDSISLGASTSSSTHLDGSAASLHSRDYLLTPEPPKSALFLTPHQGHAHRRRSVEGKGGMTRFLSHSNPPVTNSAGSKRGVRAGINIPPLRVAASSPFSRHSLINLETAGSKLRGPARPHLARGTTGIGGVGGREELPSFLHKLGTPSRIPQTFAVAGRPKEIAPPSWRPTGGQNSLEAEKRQLQDLPMRNRSLTEPQRMAKPKPKGTLALQNVLQQASLGEYYDLFSEQELDLGSFLTLTEDDLIDLCITNGNDRQRLLTLIRRLQHRNVTRSPVEQNGARPNGAAPAPVFLFQ